MILSIEEVKEHPEFKDIDTGSLKEMLDAVEDLVRKYTNNNFQIRPIRFVGSSNAEDPTVIYGNPKYLKVGDTVQITQSEANDGLYVVEGVGEDRIVVDRDLYPSDHNRVTKVEYPKAVKQGVLNILKWEVTSRDKVGIKSETLSRHSVTYFDLDANNQVNGYPVSLLGFLDLYKKARFE